MRIIPKLLLVYLKINKKEIFKIKIKEFLMSKIRYEFLLNSFQNKKNFDSILENLN